MRRQRRTEEESREGGKRRRNRSRTRMRTRRNYKNQTRKKQEKENGIKTKKKQEKYLFLQDFYRNFPLPIHHIDHYTMQHTHCTTEKPQHKTYNSTSLYCTTPLKTIPHCIHHTRSSHTKPHHTQHDHTPPPQPPKTKRNFCRRRR